MRSQKVELKKKNNIIDWRDNEDPYLNKKSFQCLVVYGQSSCLYLQNLQASMTVVLKGCAMARYGTQKCAARIFQMCAEIFEYVNAPFKNSNF